MDPFTDKQIVLLQTFADQAVIAIQNVRLFTELEARNTELRVALEQQTATADILRVIEQLPNRHPAGARHGGGERRSPVRGAGCLHLPPRRRSALSRRPSRSDRGRPVGDFSLPLVPGMANGRAVLDARTIHVADIQAAVDEFPEGSDNARQYGHRTVLTVPRLREGVAIGSISLRRTVVQPFTEQQVTLLQTFADQAVIAIENVRLVTELQVKNADLTEALEQQTATSEILRVIAGSPTNLQPVLDTVAENAARGMRGFRRGARARRGPDGSDRSPLRADIQRLGQDVPAHPRLGHGPGDHRPAADPCSGSR